MGKVFKSFGLLPFDEVIEVDASKLQTGYVGQAGKLVTETLEQAKGKVLFIDEARARTPPHRTRRGVAAARLTLALRALACSLALTRAACHFCRVRCRCVLCP